MKLYKPYLLSILLALGVLSLATTAFAVPQLGTNPLNGNGQYIYNLGGISLGGAATSSNSISIPTGGGIIFPGGTQTAPFLGSSQTVTAGNISNGVFGYPTASNAYSFPAYLGVSTTTTVGLPQNLSVYGGGYFSGNVGIGTTGPGAKLDVENGQLKVATDISSGDAWLTLKSANTNNYVHAGLSIGAGGAISPWNIYQSGSSGLLRFNYNTISDTGGQVVIDTSGNVGIGTTSPTYKLDVAGSFRAVVGNSSVQYDSSGNVIISL